MRLFAALVPPPEALEHLDEFLDVRRDAGEFRWVQADQVHVTLAFLDHVPDHKLDDLVERLGRAASRRAAFETAISGGGAFPNAGRAKVLWAGLDLDEPGRTELDRLATGCRAAASRAGIAVDGAQVPAAPHRGPHQVSARRQQLGPAPRLLRGAAVAGDGADARPVVPRRGPARPPTACAPGHLPADPNLRSVGSAP